MLLHVIVELSLILVASVFATPLLLNLERKGHILQDGSYKIVNGTPTDIKYHPYQAAIFYRGSFFISGAIVDKKWILTIAIPPVYVRRFKVGVGHTKLSEEETTYDVETSVLHPSYSLGTEYNLSLLKLKKPLKFSKKVKKISINSATPTSNTSAVVSGWGWIEGGNTTDVLRKADLSIIDKETCKSAYIASVVSSTTFCGYKDEHVYPFILDNGDPLVQKNKLVGLYLSYLAFPGFCNDKSYCPSIFTDVTQFGNWINSVIRNN